MVFIACYHPLIMEHVGFKRTKDGTVCKDMKCNPYLSVDDLDLDDKSGRYVPVPCGQCVGCRLDYSRQWANRMMLELESHKSAYFLTLTYNDEHLNFGYASDPLTGEALGNPVASLRKRDIQLFMKRLRKYFSNQRIRFYASGEYGDLSQRPHYHLIVFGLELDDLEYYKSSELINGHRHTYYLSPSLEKCWGKIVVDENGKKVKDENGEFVVDKYGYVVVSQVTWETCAYTARYVMKKLKGEAAQEYERLGIEPPFSLMSRKPGLGGFYLEQHPDCLDYNFINISTPNGGKEIVAPKYIQNLFAEQFPVDFDEIHEIRVTAARENIKAKLAQTNKSYSQILADEEFATKQKIKTLRRKSI